MPLSNQIAGFFDRQYLWKKYIDIVNFLHVDMHQGDSIWDYYFWVMFQSIPNHAQICIDLLRVALGNFGGITRLKVIQNKILIDLKVTKNILCSCPIMLQDSLITKLSGRKQPVSYFFFKEMFTTGR